MAGDLRVAGPGDPPEIMKGQPPRATRPAFPRLMCPPQILAMFSASVLRIIASIVNGGLFDFGPSAISSPSCWSRTAAGTSRWIGSVNSQRRPTSSPAAAWPRGAARAYTVMFELAPRPVSALRTVAMNSHAGSRSESVLPLNEGMDRTDTFSRCSPIRQLSDKDACGSRTHLKRFCRPSPGRQAPAS